MTDDPPRDPRDPQPPRFQVQPTLTVAFHPPQYAQALPVTALARLDARLAHLHPGTPDDALHATLRDAARLLGAHLTYRDAGRTVHAHPWQADTALIGVGVRRATHLLHLRGATRHDPAAFRAAVSRWPTGTLLVARRGVVCAQLNLACDLDRLSLDEVQASGAAVYAHRLRPGGQLESWRTSGWPDP
ncbi:hypothetical protein [Deinococcus sp. RM]|uniref:hypothetical protein n=1 Tax=Deinococcus sp. RM TaxID=2316359 RepID=UPI000E699A09|nr:hypothetical protein [Deinococcus sp. RM]RIY01755.1 hypothetical protein D3W47_15100 [Deinococcus sp. RM]